jgi:hypothetical protein
MFDMRRVSVVFVVTCLAVPALAQQGGAGPPLLLDRRHDPEAGVPLRLFPSPTGEQRIIGLDDSTPDTRVPKLQRWMPSAEDVEKLRRERAAELAYRCRAIQARPELATLVERESIAKLMREIEGEPGSPAVDDATRTCKGVVSAADFDAADRFILHSACRRCNLA